MATEPKPDKPVADSAADVPPKTIIVPTPFTVDQAAALRAAIDTITSTRSVLTAAVLARTKLEAEENRARAEYATAVQRYRALIAALAGLDVTELRA